MPEKYINKECINHGLTKFVFENRGYYRCVKCRYEKVTKRRHKIKQLLIEYFGSKCSKCGYNKCIRALEFHHIDPKNKKFDISGNGLTKSFEACLEEAKKCILVCANCHRELE